MVDDNLLEIDRKRYADDVTVQELVRLRVENDKQREGIERLRVENERMKAALERIAQHDIQAWAMDAVKPHERIRKQEK